MEIQRPESHQPLPPHAKRVFKGDIFDVYQWEQELYDGSKVTFEKLSRDDTVVVVPTTPDRKLLLLDEEQPGSAAILTFPAGRMDKEGEGPLQAAQRELKEETGYESHDWELWKAYQPVAKIDWAVYIFVARGCRKTSALQLDAGERITTEEVALERILELLDDPRFTADELKADFVAARHDVPSRELLEKRLFG